MCRVTIFTPTYNRKDTLTRLYNSILEQTYKDFEWLIIDDGSTDNTDEFIKQFIEEDRIAIRYLKQSNTHKFYTILKASKLAVGEFIYIFDSDDVLKPEALEILISTWDNIPKAEIENFSGVTGLCVDQHGTLVGTKFPKSPFDSDTIECYYKYKMKGEKSGFIRTEILSRFDFDDEYFSNGYIPEGILWFKIANLGYKTRYINEVLRIYYVDEGIGSIMSNVNTRRNSFGSYQHSLLVLNLPLKYWLYSPKKMLSRILVNMSSGFYENKSIIKMVKPIKSILVKTLFIMSVPFGIIFHKIRK